jgi:aminoglycoside phosphotransferase (APT) family kinase protein
LPIVFEQRDCSPWNILLNDKGEVRILDWESSEPCGLPVLDLIYFLTYLSFFIEGAMETKKYVKTYRNAFDPQTLIGKFNQDCLDKYCAVMNVDTLVLKPLRLLTWLIHSRSEYQRLLEDQGGRPTLSALRTSLFATLVREEIRA